MAADRWSVLCDFDGTISLTDVIDSLLQTHGREGWRQLESDWLAGHIGSRECMQQQVTLLDLDLDTLHAQLDGIAIDPQFKAFLAAAEQRGYPVSVVSDGLDYAIDYILQRHDITGLPVAANHLTFTSLPGQWQLASPHQEPGCSSGTCKCACIGAVRISQVGPVLLIGDGASDFCAAQRADYIFAKGRLRDHCLAHGLKHTAISGFADALQLLPQLAQLHP
jgi:2,3-diketo-5-methylthio-1-phosphopentane phosphatase